MESFDADKRQVPGYNAAKEKNIRGYQDYIYGRAGEKETARCLSCGATKVDEYLCVGCGLCTTKCEFDAIRLEMRTDMKPVQAGTFETMPIKVAEHVVKKVGKIAVKNGKRLTR